MKKETSTEILILDFNRPNELKTLILSLKKYANFNNKIVVLNNGGERYADELLKQGLVDKVINNRINVGCGLGTIQLFSQCESDYAFYIQVDHCLNYELTEDNICDFKNKIEREGYLYVDLAGNQGAGRYSERAQFINKNQYLSIPKMAGGPGPLDDLLWTEESVQNYMEFEMSQFYSFYKMVEVDGRMKNFVPFKDCGWGSVRENPDGSQWYHYPDTKVLYCLSKPTEKFTFPPFDEEEWNVAISGNWPKEGKIPKEWKENSFEVWNKLPEK